MVNLRFFLLIALLVLLSRQAKAQNNLEDVIYTKGGNIYRGLVIEQVPGESMKIRIEGGSVFTIAISDIQKLTKEEKWNSAPATTFQTIPAKPPVTEKQKLSARYRARYDSTFVPHYKKKRTYFFLAEVRGGIGNGGVRIVNGYKIGRFGFFGAGIGIDGASFGAANYSYNGNYYYNSFSNGAYMPVYFRYAGDILRTRITPFYYTELGYAVNITNATPFSNGDGVKRYGGPIGTIGFGCKFNTYRRVNFNLNLNATWRTNFYSGNVYAYDSNGNYYTYYTNGSNGSLFGNFSFGIGF